MELPFCGLVVTILGVCLREIDGNSVTLTPSPVATVTEGDTLKLQCNYSGSYTLIAVNWYLNGNSFGLEIIASSCDYQSTPSVYEISRYNKTCSTNSFSLFITNVAKDKDDSDIWECDTTPLGSSSPTKVSTIIKVNDKTTTSLPTTDDCSLLLGLVVGLVIAAICIIDLIFIVILVKTGDACCLSLVRCRCTDHVSVNIQDKHKLHKPIRRGSDVTITASVRGFYNSVVQWIGPHGEISASEGRCTIQYDSKTGLSMLQITNLEKKDSGVYTCHARTSRGSSAQDSVTITVYEQFAVDIDIGETLRQHGSDVNIICSVYGPEEKSVIWTKLLESIEDLITNDGRHTIAPYDNNTNKSSIRSSSITEAEDYICNVAFKDSVSVKIYINITVLENDSLRVTIEKIMLFVPASENESREWIGLQGESLTKTPKYDISHDMYTNESCLTIKDFSLNDNGSYTYQPKNSSRSSPKISITVTTNDATAPNKGASKLVLGLGFGFICVACIACIVILVVIGKPCALKFGLGLGLGLGIPLFGCIIVILILVKKVLKQPPTPENRRVQSGSRSDVSGTDVEIQMEEKGVKRPPAIHIGTQNRVDSKTPSKKASERPQPSPLEAVVTEDIPKHRPQPPPPENSDVKDRNKRGISANFDDKQGLPTEPPRSSRLPPLPQKQATVEEEDASKEKLKKKRKNKKKGQMNDGNPEEEMEELTSK